MKWLSTFLILCMACTSQDIPEDVIGINKMKVIVWDMINAGEMAQEKYGKDSSHIKLKTTELFQQVLSIYNITREEFYKSYRYYETHPDKNKILMDSLTAYANRKRQDLYKLMK